MTTTAPAPHLTVPGALAPAWKRAGALLAPVVALVLGAAMAVQWAIGGREDFRDGPPGFATVGTWMAERLPLMDGDEAVWAWRGLFFLSLVLALPFAWQVTGRAGSRTGCWAARGGLLVATGAIALEYSTPGYGWLFDLAALLVAVFGTLACGLAGLRRGTLPKRVAWPLVAVVPLTPLGGFLTFWYLPPGLAMGLLMSYALAAALAGSPRGD